MEERPDLAELQNHVTTTKWINLGLQLGLRDNDLKEIELKYSDIGGCRREMLSIWLSTSPGACRKQLLEALKTDSVAEFFIAGKYNTFIQQLSRGMFKIILCSHRPPFDLYSLLSLVWLRLISNCTLSSIVTLMLQ